MTDSSVFLEVKKMPNRFIEMNVDGNGSVSSNRSSLKRRAPTAPHVSQTNLHQTKDPVGAEETNSFIVPSCLDNVLSLIH